MDSISKNLLNIYLNISNSNAKKLILLVGTGLVIYVIRKRNSKLSLKIDNVKISKVTYFDFRVLEK